MLPERGTERRFCHGQPGGSSMSLHIRSALLIGALILAATSFNNVHARCSGETNLDPNSPCYTGTGDVDTLRATSRLDNVVVIGASSAPFNPYVGSQLWFDDLAVLQINRYEAAAGAVLGAIVATIIPVVSPLLPKCAVTTNLNLIKTPDQDAGQNWLIAKDAIILAFGTNWGSVRIGQRVDVKYPSGDVVRLILTTVPSDPDARAVVVMRFLDGIPSGASPCA